MHPVERFPALADLQDAFIARAHRMVWCNLTTLDRRGRPRSRMVHPIWEGPVGWIGTLGNTPKVRQLQANRYVSLAYIADMAKPVYADCIATWVDDPAECARIWELFRSTPEPLGYDPVTAFQGMDMADFGLIRLAPYRIEVTNFPHGTRVWQQPDA
jgi:hypothetical protein